MDDALPFRPTVEIDLDALIANFQSIARKTPQAEAGAVVKCNAYGLGARVVAASLALGAGCRSFFVAYPEEGADVRAALDRARAQADIYVFLGPDRQSQDIFHRARLTPVLNTLEQARLWAGATPGAPAAVHVDTGINRLGLDPAQLDEFLSVDGLSITLVMTHLANGHDPDSPENARQREAARALAARFPGVRLSLAATGGALIDASYGFDMTRIGVGAFGASPGEAPLAGLTSVARLSAPVVQLRRAPAGAAIGYGGAHVLTRDSLLATVLLGYGDGLHRRASNRGSAVLGGALRPILGRVSMDLIVLDATDAPRAPAIGDRAEFFGPLLPVEHAAAAAGTSGYEFLTSLGRRVERLYRWRGAPAGWRAGDYTVQGASS